jgi:carboxymethylenebutenolidase
MVVRRGSEIEYHVGGRAISAYVAGPYSGTGPGVLVVHDVLGLDDFARDVCDRLARAEFVALAPDLLDRNRADDAGSAERQAKELDIPASLAVLDAGVLEVFNQHSTDGMRVGVLGFGMGGQLALALAGENPRVGAVADFYGWHPEVTPNYEALDAAVLAILSGEDSESEEPSSQRLEANLAASGVRYKVQTRDGVRAGFMDDSRPDVHDAVAEFECWDTLLTFLRAELS